MEGPVVPLSWGSFHYGLPVGDLSFPRLPPELRRMIRGHLRPIDVLRCGRVCRAWRDVVHTTCSLHDLVSSYQNEDPAGEITVPVDWTHALLLEQLRKGDLSEYEAHQRFRRTLQWMLQIIEAQYLAVPASALQAIQFATADSDMDHHPLLDGPYLARVVDDRQLEVLDLVRSERHISPRRYPRDQIDCFAITGDYCAYAIRDSFYHGRIDELDSLDSLQWDQDLYEDWPGGSNAVFSSGVEAIAAGSLTTIAIRSMRLDGREGLGLLSFRHQSNGYDLGFVPLRLNHVSCAAVLDGDACVIFLIATEPHACIRIIRLDSLCDGIALTKTIDCHTRYITMGDGDIELRRIGLDGQIEVRHQDLHILVNLRDLSYMVQKEVQASARWRDKIFHASGSAVCAKNGTHDTLSRFWHTYHESCEETTDILVNDLFLVALHLPAGQPEQCPCYHAFSFDPIHPVATLPKQNLCRWRRFH